jgi:hypothetical protein
MSRDVIRIGKQWRIQALHRSQSRLRFVVPSGHADDAARGIASDEDARPREREALGVAIPTGTSNAAGSSIK